MKVKLFLYITWFCLFVGLSYDDRAPLVSILHNNYAIDILIILCNINRAMLIILLFKSKVIN